MAAETAQDDSRFYVLLEKLFKEIDQAAIQAEVEALRKAKPKKSREELAEELTKKAAVRVASVGAAAGVAGGPLGVLAMAPDIFNLVLQQSRLVLSIAFLYDRQPNLRERFREVLATLAVATGASAGRQGVRFLITKGIERAAAAKMAKKLFGRYLVRRIPAVAPILGTVAGGTINYLSMRAVGKTAVAYYGKPEEGATGASKPAAKKATKRTAGKKSPTRKAVKKSGAPAKKATRSKRRSSPPSS